MASKFTDLMIRNLQPPPKGRLLHTEGHGLYLQVNAGGKKSWQFIYSWQGKQKWIPLGAYPGVSIAMARQRARGLQDFLDRGIDPKAHRDEEDAAITVSQLIDIYIEKHAKPNKKSWPEDVRCLNKDVVPAWGARKAKDIKKRDAITLLESIAERAPIQSNNVLEVTRKVFNFGIERDLIEFSPFIGVKPISRRTPKTRTLKDDEIHRFWYGLDNTHISSEIRRALKLILLTAQRPGEVIGMSWEEVDGSWWHIPDERSKNGRGHRVYLTPFALELLGPRSSGYVFTSPKGGKPIESNAVAAAVRKNLEKFGIPAWTPHDLRRTAATMLAGLGFSNETIDRLLNHVTRGVIAVYNLHRYDDEKRKALEVWSDRVIAIVSRGQR